MDNTEYDKQISDFHSQLTIKILTDTSESRYRKTMQDVPAMLEEFMTSFNSTIAKPFLEQIKSKVHSTAQFDLYPEQFRASKDGEEALKELIVKDAEARRDGISNSLNKYGHIMQHMMLIKKTENTRKETTINPNVFKIQIDSIKNDIEGSIYIIAKEFSDYLSKKGPIGQNQAENYISVFYPLSRGNSLSIKDILPDFDNQLEKFLIKKDPVLGPDQAKLFKEVFENIDKRYQVKRSING